MASEAGNSPGPTLPKVSVAPGSYVSATAAGPGLLADDAISKVVAGLSPERVVQGVSIVPATDGAALPTIQTTLNTNTGPADQGYDVRAAWLGALVEGAVFDYERTTQPALTDVVSGAQVVEPGLDGASTQTIPLGVANVAGGQVFDAPTDSALAHRVVEAAQKFGLTVVTEQISHPRGTALDVTFSAPDTLKPTWTMMDLDAALTGSPMELEGSLIQIQTESGKPLLASAAAYRAGYGSLWFAPGQDVRFGAGHQAKVDPSALAPADQVPAAPPSAR